MDFTIINTCPACKRPALRGHGGQFGGRVTIVNLKCDCGATFVLIPTREEYRYEIKATTEAERKEERIEKLKADTALELAKKIAEIRGN